MRPRLSIRTMLIAGALLSAGSAPALPLKNSPPERENTVNLNDKRYVTAGDRAYLMGVQDGSQVPAASLNPANGIGGHITGQMGGVWPDQASPGVPTLFEWQPVARGYEICQRSRLCPTRVTCDSRDGDQ